MSGHKVISVDGQQILLLSQVTHGLQLPDAQLAEILGKIHARIPVSCVKGTDGMTAAGQWALPCLDVTVQYVAFGPLA